MKTLVTGASGQLGQNVVRAFADHGDSVLATDILPSQRFPDGVEWRALDVTDATEVGRLVEEFAPQRIVHLAAVLSARGEGVPEIAYRVNQTGTYNLLEAARRFQCKQFLFTSTIAVYGPGTSSPAPDSSELLPTTLYGATKAAGEMLGHYYFTRFGLDFRAVRYPGIIGANLPGGGTSDYSVYMYYEAARGNPYTAFCRPDTRIPLMYDRDSTRALVALSQAPRSELSRSTYNIAAFSPTAEELASAVRRAVPGTRIDFDVDLARQAILDSWPDELDDATARNDWGWKPDFDVASMTDDLVPRMRELCAQ